MTFCVKCGKDIKDSINGLCSNCFIEDKPLLYAPHHVDLEICTNCDDIHSADKWLTKPFLEAIEDAALASVSAINEAEVLESEVEIREQDPRTYLGTVSVKLAIKEVEVETEISTIVRIKNTVCKRCSRQLGSYYESILQLRTGGRADMGDALRNEVVSYVRTYVEEHSRSNKQLFITKMGDVTGGVDVFLSSIMLGRHLSKELSDIYGGETKESSSLVGVNSTGEELYRVTYLVRFPEYHIGDIVFYENRMYKLSGLSKTGGRLTDLLTFRDMSVRRSQLPSLRIHQKFDDRSDATVISKSEKEIQVLHPTNYSTIDIRIPEGLEVGETVRVVDYDDAIYYVP